jgi:hypothetical protein
VAITSETWNYERKLRRDQKGIRWHFVSRFVVDPDVPFDDRPYELYFRNDDRTEFGLLRFEHRKDNPYRDYEAAVTKIMNNAAFRQKLRDPATASIWRKGWK